MVNLVGVNSTNFWPGPTRSNSARADSVEFQSRLTQLNFDLGYQISSRLNSAKLYLRTTHVEFWLRMSQVNPRPRTTQVVAYARMTSLNFYQDWFNQPFWLGQLGLILVWRQFESIVVRNDSA